MTAVATVVRNHEEELTIVEFKASSRKARRYFKAAREVSYPLSPQSFADEEEILRQTQGEDADLYIKNYLYWEGYRNRCHDETVQEIEWQLCHNGFSASQEAGLRKYA